MRALEARLPRWRRRAGNLRFRTRNLSANESASADPPRRRRRRVHVGNGKRVFRPDGRPDEPVDDSAGRAGGESEGRRVIPAGDLLRSQVGNPLHANSRRALPLLEGASATRSRRRARAACPFRKRPSIASSCPRSRLSNSVALCRVAYWSRSSRSLISGQSTSSRPSAWKRTSEAKPVAAQV